MMEKFLEENAHAPDGSHRTQPILTRETMAYTFSLSISCVCLHANSNHLKGRASAAYVYSMYIGEEGIYMEYTWYIPGIF